MIRSKVVWLGSRSRYVVGGVGSRPCACAGILAMPQTPSPESTRLVWTRTATVPTTGKAIVTRSYHHRASGYLAGLHSYQPKPGGDAPEESPPDFDSFESAWEAIQSVPEDLLNDFEDELWETQSRRFVYGTKEVSVLDAVETCHNKNNSNTNDVDKEQVVFRYLICNERPNLIQTAVEVAGVGAPYHHYSLQEESTDAKSVWTARPPAPISQTHLGGLAMALPLWHKANGISDDRPISPHQPHRHPSPPNCLLIGAGGCSLAHTMAANLFLDLYNNNNNNNSIPTAMPGLTAVEACPEILRASRLWFGARTGDNEEDTTSHSGNVIPEPPFFDLVHDTGESYLESLVESYSRRAQTEMGRDSKPPRPVDILIIDAEDGAAPPASMRTPKFWKELVLPCLNPAHAGGSIVGVNSIGSDSETSTLVRTLREAFGGDTTVGGPNYRILVVTPPPMAQVTARHKLVFVLPWESMATTEDQAQGAAYWSISQDDLKCHVDAPEAWEEQLKMALREAVDE